MANKPPARPAAPRCDACRHYRPAAGLGLKQMDAKTVGDGCGPLIVVPALDADQAFGTCRRQPPAATGKPTRLGPLGQFPLVFAQWVCGEFSAAALTAPPAIG